MLCQNKKEQGRQNKWCSVPVSNPMKLTRNSERAYRQQRCVNKRTAGIDEKRFKRHASLPASKRHAAERENKTAVEEFLGRAIMIERVAQKSPEIQTHLTGEARAAVFCPLNHQRAADLR